jgi:hypothetical protein
MLWDFRFFYFKIFEIFNLRKKFNFLNIFIVFPNLTSNLVF